MSTRARAGHRVLVLDGETRAALAVVRSLGQHKIDVGVAAAYPGGMAQKSNFSTTIFECPDPVDAPEMYLKWIAEVLENWKPRLVLPLTNITLMLCLRIEEIIQASSILPSVTPETLDAITNKADLMRTATALGINTPRSHLIPQASHRTEEDDQIIHGFQYPAVLKPNNAASDVVSHFVKSPVFYPEEPEDVTAVIHGDFDIEHEKIPFLLQEKVEGQSICVSALCHQGEALAQFANKRILEKPPSGGKAVLSESIPLSDAPLEEALALFRHYSIDGMASAEFKRTEDGTHHLIGFSPRFSSTLQLAIDSGRDFPAMLFKLYLIETPFPEAALEQFRSTVAEYESGRRLRWELGTLEHFFSNCKDAPVESLKKATRKNSLQLWKRKEDTRKEVWRAGDVKPFFFELRRYIIDLFSNTPSDY